MAAKTNLGNFFEDFSLGQVLVHATPRTVNVGDIGLYQALYGSRFVVQSSDDIAMAMGYREAPLDDLLVFHIVFGKTVPDISLNAIANLGYAECRFLGPVFPGDTLSSRSEVIGLRETGDRKAGVVYVRSAGYNQDGECVLEYVRWVLVKKRDVSSPAPEAVVPKLVNRVDPSTVVYSLRDIDTSDYDLVTAGSPFRFDNYTVGEKIDHVDGMTIEEAEHQIATRLYQNTARVHFNNHVESKGRFGKRIVYGGVVMSIARALSFNGLGNAFHIAAINGGRHAAPAFAGDTVYAWSEVLELPEHPHGKGIGFMRIRTVALKNRSAEGFPYKKADGEYEEGVILDLDYWVAIPK